MTDEEIIENIGRFPRWHYQFDLRGHKTPIFDASHINRHRQREAYFFRPVVQLFSGSPRGKRVLDLGCNAGFWSLRAVEAGCDYVLGIDGWPMHIDQAHFVFRASDIDRQRYDFRLGNVFDVLAREGGRFDVVLCLGLFYHVCKHMTLLEEISRLNSDLLVIDTSLCVREGPVLELAHEPLDEPRNACDYELVMLPSRQAVLDMVSEFGYRVITLEPDFDDYSGAEDFRTGRRRAFLGAKYTNLVSLTAPHDKKQPGSGVHGDGP